MITKGGWLTKIVIDTFNRDLPGSQVDVDVDVGGLVCGVVAATAGGIGGGYLGDKAGSVMGDGINYLLYKGK